MSSVRRERRFKFKGGVVCLDFVNTLAWRLTDRPVEYLLSYEDLLAALNHELSGALSRLRVAPVAGDTYVWAWERGGYCQVCVHKSLM